MIVLLLLLLNLLLHYRLHSIINCLHYLQDSTTTADYHALDHNTHQHTTGSDDGSIWSTNLSCSIRDDVGICRQSSLSEISCKPGIAWGARLKASYTCRMLQQSDTNHAYSKGVVMSLGHLQLTSWEIKEHLKALAREIPSALVLSQSLKKRH